MRLIDADRLIEGVNTHNYCRRCRYSDECYLAEGEQITCEKYLIRDIKEQPTVTKWIPVSERLPEEYGNYNVYTGDDRVCEYDIGTWGNGDWSGCNAYGFVPHINVIAWMPIPEYRGDDND